MMVKEEFEELWKPRMYTFVNRLYPVSKCE
jgi:hypothetical protein